MIVIIDYGMGNLRSVAKAIENQGGECIISSDPDVISNAKKLLLPGVGAFKLAIAGLRNSGLDKVIIDTVNKGIPILGICLGMQLLYQLSEEDGFHRGLGLIDGTVTKFTGDYKIPHMGWNSIKIIKPKLLAETDPMMYFVHSYYAPISLATASICNYAGVDFSSSIEQNNIFATQFHPEKSSDIGLKIINNFINL